jgi:hypothetical protein
MQHIYYEHMYGLQALSWRKHDAVSCALLFEVTVHASRLAPSCLVRMQAVEQDPEYLKAWQRRALVRKQLGNTLGCLDDLQHALLLAPGSAAIGRELRSVLQARMHEVGLRMPEDLTSVPVLMEDAAPPNHGSSSKQQRNASASRGPSDLAAHASDAGQIRLSQVPDANAIEQDHPGMSTAPAERSESPASTASRSHSVRSASGRTSPLAGLDLPTRPSHAPSTGAEFVSSWRGLKGDPAAQAQYLRLIERNALPRILRSSLTPHLLEGITSTALQQLVVGSEGGTEAADAELGVKLLQELANTPRFAMNAMLIPRGRRKVLVDAWAAALRATAGWQEDALVQLRSVYKL